MTYDRARGEPLYGGMVRVPRIALKHLPPERRAEAVALRRMEREAERARIRAHFLAAGLPAPEPEYAFEPARRWRVDWAWLTQRLALEIEGGVWSDGRHTRPSGFLRDVEKYNALAIRGWRLLRTTPDQLYVPATVALVRAALDV
jgi:very-short-patch-repair endonuclease